jgi:competence protein ComEA
MRLFFRFAIVVIALGLGCGAGVFAQALQPAAPAPSVAPAPAKPAAPAAELLDINAASVEELDVLPGVGAARAAAIVKGRPYKGKDELHRRKIIPKSVYDKIKDKIIARQK